MSSTISFNPSAQNSASLSDPNALLIDIAVNQVKLIPSLTPNSITPAGLGYASGPDMNNYLGIDYQSNFIALDFPYVAPINNQITGVNIPLQAPWGSYNWSSVNATVQLLILKDENGVPDFSHPLCPAQSASLSSILGTNDSGQGAGIGHTVGIDFVLPSVVAVAKGQKIHFVLVAGADWPNITDIANGYTLVCPNYDPDAKTNTFGPISCMYANASNQAIISSDKATDASALWQKSNHVGSFTVKNSMHALSTTSPFVMYMHDAGQIVSWNFGSFMCAENLNGESGSVSYSVLITNADPDYAFQTSCILYKSHISQSQLKSLASVKGQRLFLQVHLNSPDGIMGASAGVASISYHV